MKKKILSLSLILILCLNLLPITVSAAEARRSVMLDASELTTGDLILYGNYDLKTGYGTGPLKWHILDPHHTSDGADAGLFLLSKDPVRIKIPFSLNGDENWMTSYARNWCDAFIGIHTLPTIPSAFSDWERNALLAVRKTEEPTKINGKSWERSEINDMAFFLSAQELHDCVDESIRYAGNHSVEGAVSWWLRSPDPETGFPISVGIVPTPDSSQVSAPLSERHNPRPAINLNKENILMFQPANVGNQSVLLMSPVTDVETNEWKMTIRDGAFQYFAAYGTPDGKISYFGAKNGPNDGLSGIIVDDATGEPIQFGSLHVNDLPSENGSMRFRISTDMTGKSFYVFNERRNPKNQSNQGSELFHIAQLSDMQPPAEPVVMAGTTGLNTVRPWVGNPDYIYYMPQDYVYLGKNGEMPILWRVLDAEKTNDAQPGVFLLSEQALEEGPYLTGWNSMSTGYQGSWEGSDGQAYCEHLMEKGFAPAEYAALHPASLLEPLEDTTFRYYRDWAGNELKEERMFFLSIPEVYQYMGTANHMGSDQKCKCWLRSPHYNTGEDNRIDAMGSLQNGLVFPHRGDWTDMGYRPATNLRPEQILFTTQAGQGIREGLQQVLPGQPEQGIPESLKDVLSLPGNIWELTLLDPARTGFQASLTDDGTLNWTGAKTGPNEYITALVQQKDTGVITAYGQLCAVGNQSSGAVKVDLSGLDLQGAVLKVCNEQCNEGSCSYAGPLLEVYDMVTAPSTIHITEENFPDPNFRSFLQETEAGADGMFTFSERQAMILLNCNGRQIADLTGIDYFPNLTLLDCQNNRLSELDVSGLSKLVALRCQRNHLSHLNLEQNTALLELSCDNNRYFAADGGSLPQSFDRKKASDIQGGSLNDRTVAYAAGSEAITYDYQVGFGSEPVRFSVIRPSVFIDERTFPDPNFRKYLQGYTSVSNGDEELTATELEALTDIDTIDYGFDYPDQKIRSLKGIEQLPALKSLRVTGQALADVDLSGCKALERVSFLNNQLTSLELGSSPKLQEVDCRENQLVELDTSGLSGLRVLNCGTNKLWRMDLSKNAALEELYCENNRLQELDLSGNPELQSLNCSHNHLLYLDLINNPKTTDITCEGNSRKVAEGVRISDVVGEGTMDMERVSIAVGGYFYNGKVTFQEGSRGIIYKYRFDSGQARTGSFYLEKLFLPRMTLRQNGDLLVQQAHGSVLLIAAYDADGKFVNCRIQPIPNDVPAAVYQLKKGQKAFLLNPMDGRYEPMYESLRMP